MSARFLVLLAVASTSFDADAADWLIAPYGWLPQISLDQSSDDSGDGGGGISGSDLLSKTESVFMMRFEAAQSRWGFMSDYITLSLADRTTLSARPPLNLELDVNTELDLDVLEVGGFYRPSAEIAGINYLFGVRRIGSDKRVVAVPGIGPAQTFESDVTVTDVYLGARYIYRVGSRWDFTVRGDYGFGDSDGTLNLLGSVGFRVAGPFGLQLGYRYASIEFEDDVDGVPESVDITLSGSYLGFVFRF